MTQYTEIFVETDKLDTIENIAALILANDTIRIALNIVGIDPNGLNQFERASALLDMAQELAALTDKRQCNARGEGL